MVGIADFFVLAQQNGIFNFYLPFVLVFAVFYGLLQKSNIFGTDKISKRLNAVIALVAALYVVGFTPVGVQLVSFADYLATLFTDAAVVIVTLLVFLMIWYMLGAPGKPAQNNRWWFIFVVLVGLVVLAMFFNAGGGAIFGFVSNIGGGLGINFSGQDVAVIVLIVVTVVVIYWLTRGEESQQAKSS